MREIRIGGDCFLIEGGGDILTFEPEIHPDDSLLVQVPEGYQPERLSPVETWTFIRDGDICLVADAFPLKLRRLRWRRTSIEVIKADGTVERTLVGVSADFTLFGIVIWRGGIIPDAKFS